MSGMIGMAMPLLTTKHHVPRVRPTLVSRPRLIERLNAGLERQLTLISAPAGFGKTTLLTEWVGRSRLLTFDSGVVSTEEWEPHISNPTPQIYGAWLSLDEGDNDLTRFLGYFVAALRTIPRFDAAGIGGSILGTLQPSGSADVDTSLAEILLVDLINEITAVGPDRLVLILDDCHTVKSPAVHDRLAFLLDHMPDNMHLVIATRADPPLPLGRLRGRGQLIELRQGDLRFTVGEAAEFLNQIMGLSLSADDVVALASRTEGWIAGLQMAALSMQGQGDVAGFIRAFTGSDRYILDYLVEEVLQGQPELVRTFLLHTSVLDRLSGPLCDALVGDLEIHRFADSSQEILEYLERNNIFIFPLDNERRWYRYHSLFADLLLRRLRQARPDLVGALHRRAGWWYQRNGPTEAAVSHALAGGDYEWAADFIEGIAEATLMRSEVLTFLRWVEALSDELVLARPSLVLFHAWALLLSGRSIDAVEARLQSLTGDVGPSRGKVSALRARIAVLRGQMAHAVEFSSQAIAELPEDDLFSRGMAKWTMGIAQWASGDILAGSRALKEAAQMNWGTGNVMVSVMTLCRLAGLHIVQGRLHEAKAAYEQALSLATDERGQRLPVAGEALIGLGELAREWNHLEAATRHLTEGIELAEGWGEFGALGGYLSLARVRLAQGDMNGAGDMLRRAQQLAAKTDGTKVDDLTVALAQARLWIAQGNVEAALGWAEERGLALSQVERLGDPVSLSESEGEDDLVRHHLRKYEYITLARVLLAQDRLGEALALLDRLSPLMVQRGRPKSVIEIQVLRALAHQAQGDMEQAMTGLGHALSLAESSGYVRIFLDEGAPMAELLRRAASLGAAGGYARELLAAFGVVEQRGVGEPPLRATTQSLPDPLLEPLSERELEILRLLTTYLSSTEIAEELTISVNTVRFHIKNIYSKLGVHRRSDAVYRAEQLGLL